MTCCSHLSLGIGSTSRRNHFYVHLVTNVTIMRARAQSSRCPTRGMRSQPEVRARLPHSSQDLSMQVPANDITAPHIQSHNHNRHALTFKALPPAHTRAGQHKHVAFHTSALVVQISTPRAPCNGSGSFQVQARWPNSRAACRSRLRLRRVVSTVAAASCAALSALLLWPETRAARA
jgi:hypothetical protein